MKKLALYREFRPAIFDEVIGQDHIVKTLKNQVEKSSFAHAYLLCGTRGTGKTSVAKIFAKAINCIDPQEGNPCGKCNSCTGANFDIIEIDAASNNGVDKIRELRENIKFLPLSSKYKVYIIDEVHMLSEGAFNALLKTLEEPPSHAVFILATTEVQKLPQTILSRCIRFDFRLVSKTDLTMLLNKILKTVGATSDKASLDIIVSAAEGSVRDMLSIADRCVSYCDNNLTLEKVLAVLGGVNKEVVLNLTEDILNTDIENATRKLNTMLSDGKSVNNLIKELLTIYKDLTLINITQGKDMRELISFPITFYDRLCKLATETNKEALGESLNILSSLETEIKTSTIGNLLLSVSIIRLALIADENKNTKKNSNFKIEIPASNATTIQKIEKTIEAPKQIKESDIKTIENEEETIKNNKIDEIETNIQQSTNNNNFKEVLGRLLIELRESKNIALSLILSDVADGFIEKGMFNIYCKKEDERFLNNNKQIFETTFEELAEDLKFKAIGIEEKKTGDIVTSLEKMFGDKLKKE